MVNNALVSPYFFYGEFPRTLRKKSKDCFIFASRKEDLSIWEFIKVPLKYILSSERRRTAWPLAEKGPPDLFRSLCPGCGAVW